jgi:hypothetical protein
MKFNWKVLVAVVVIFGTVFWAASSTRARSYTGSNLEFAVGNGAVVVTNGSDDAVPVQLMGTGSRSFRIDSSIEGVEGTSTREGSGSAATQLFEFASPPGISEFTISRGTNVNFVAGDTRLEAVVQPGTAGEMQMTRIAAAIVVLAALYFISNTTGHSWIKNLLPSKETPVAPEPVAPADSGGQGDAIRSYGDNRGASSK